MGPELTEPYDNCKQCGKRIRLDRSIFVQGIYVHGVQRDDSFAGRFCSPACLDKMVIGAAKKVGRPTGAYGSEPAEWAQEEDTGEHPLDCTCGQCFSEYDYDKSQIP